jgi:hypothetical protein
MGRRCRASEKMTVEKLKSYPGCEELTDEAAREILFSLERLSEILVDSHRKAQIKSDDCSFDVESEGTAAHEL